jgi:WD40 repeat protein
VSRQQANSKAIPALSHEEVVGHLLEYQFGRLSPRMNAAVEAHVKQCRICQRQGLGHAATERRATERRARRVRPKPARRMFSQRGRNFLIVLALIAIVQICIIELTGGPNSPLLALFSSGRALPAAPATTATSIATVAVITPTTAFDAASASAVAATVSPDGKTVATAGGQGTSSAVTLWSVATGKAGVTLSWQGDTPPVSLAWSVDGTMLAAADGSTIGVWSVASRSVLWAVALPKSPAVRVYDVQAGGVLQRPDPAASFANGALLKWSTGGQLVTAPATAAGATGVPPAGGTLISLWRVGGSHVFGDGAGGAKVGISAADAAAHEAQLAWSPDGRYLFWATTSQPVAVPAVGTGTATPSPSATPAAHTGVPVPDAVVGTLAHAVAASAHGDALVWFAPDGHQLVACDRSNSSNDLNVYDVSTGRVLAHLPDVCAHMQLTSLAWIPSRAAFALVADGKPIAIYTVVTPAS